MNGVCYQLFVLVRDKWCMLSSICPGKYHMMYVINCLSWYVINDVCYQLFDLISNEWCMLSIVCSGKLY